MKKERENEVIAAALICWDECESSAKTPYELAAMQLNAGRKPGEPIENVNTIARRIAQAGGLEKFMAASGVAPRMIPDAVRRITRAQPQA